jgi:hypothetical protein
LKFKAASYINISKESQALVDNTLGSQKTLEPPSGGFSLIAYCRYKLPTHSKQLKEKRPHCCDPFV